MKTNRPFYVVNQMDSNKYLDMVGRDLVIKTHSDRKSQIWFWHYDSRTMRNFNSFNQKGNQRKWSWAVTNRGRGKHMQVADDDREKHQWYQIFKYDEKEMTFELVEAGDDRALDVDGAQDTEAQRTVAVKKTGQKSQKWKIVYLEKWDNASLEKQYKTKGTNKAFGFDINRDFYIVSKMHFHRVLQVHGNNVKINGIHQGHSDRKQHFFFDQRSKGIVSRADENKALSIANNGNSRNVIITNKMNRWF